MITEKEYREAQERAIKYFQKVGIVITAEEKRRIEVVDAGLGDLKRYGLEILVYVNTARCCAKELVLFPYQICCEHRHPPIDKSNPGKEETFRCRWGTIYLYVPGKPTPHPRARLPKERRKYFTVHYEIILKPGQQYILGPNTKHWFQAGPKGAVVSEFSTHAIEERDLFTDPQIERITKIVKSK